LTILHFEEELQIIWPDCVAIDSFVIISSPLLILKSLTVKFPRRSLYAVSFMGRRRPGWQILVHSLGSSGEDPVQGGLEMEMKKERFTRLSFFIPTGRQTNGLSTDRKVLVPFSSVLMRFSNCTPIDQLGYVSLTAMGPHSSSWIS
jgi:hypothetical protein